MLGSLTAHTLDTENIAWQFPMQMAPGMPYYGGQMGWFVPAPAAPYCLARVVEDTTVLPMTPSYLAGGDCTGHHPCTRPCLRRPV